MSGYTDGYGWVDGPDLEIVESLNELDWLREVVEEAEAPMGDMVEILHKHQDSQSANGGRYCICGNWEGPWTGSGFAAHQAAALSAAGFGFVADAKSEAPQLKRVRGELKSIGKNLDSWESQEHATVTIKYVRRCLRSLNAAVRGEG